MRRIGTGALILLASSLWACGPAAEPDPSVDVSFDEVSVPAEAKADGEPVRVRAGGTTLWVDTVLPHDEGGFVLHGRTSRDLTGVGLLEGRADDGAVITQGSPRTFDVRWPAEPATPALQGADQILVLHLAPSEDRADTLWVRLRLRPRVASAFGEGPNLSNELVPVVYDGLGAWRLEGSVLGAMTHVKVTVDGRRVPSVLAGDRFQAHLDGRALAALLTGGAALETTAIARRTSLPSEATVALGLKSLGVVVESGLVDRNWPETGCDWRTKECLGALPLSSHDFSSCGEAYAVLACRDELGVRAADDEVLAARERGHGLVDAMAKDAATLVGPERSEALLSALRAAVDADTAGRLGAWYLDYETLFARLDGHVDGLIDAAYARPLTLVPALEPAPGDAEVARQVAADALLQYLADAEFEATEYAKTLDQIVARWRDRHLQDIGSLRDPAGSAEVYEEAEAWLYVLQWMSSYTEVNVDRANGEATRVYVEID